MTGLLDGTTVPWHFISGKHEPGAIVLPPPVRREPTLAELQAAAANLHVAQRAFAGLPDALQRAVKEVRRLTEHIKEHR